MIILSTSCNKPAYVGKVIISVENENLFNQSDFFVEVGIVFLESDSEVLEDFGRSDISEGGMVEFDPVRLNIGNYYVRYQYYSGNSLSGPERHQPFQIQDGQNTVVEIVR